MHTVRSLALCALALLTASCSTSDSVTRTPDGEVEPVGGRGGRGGSGGRGGTGGTATGGTGGSGGSPGAGGSAGKLDAGGGSDTQGTPDASNLGGAGGGTGPDGGTRPGMSMVGVAALAKLAIPPDTGPDAPLPACKREVAVNNDATLTAALTGAQPGDCIVLANGKYKAGKIIAKGTAEAPIVIKAQTKLGAAFSTGQLVLEGAQHLVIEGLSLEMPGTFKMIDCNSCRITRNNFRLTVADDWLLIYGAASQKNRIDHNDFGPKPTPGPFLVLGQETTMSKYDRIDHNHFHDNGPPAVNEKESVRVGWSGVSRQDSFVTVENNLFENCDGDPEIVSVKANKNVVRYNTVRTSTGVLSLRHGDGSFMYGNYVLGGGKTLPCKDRAGAMTTCETGGIRIYGRDHAVFNNYIEGTTGTGHQAPIQIDGSDGTANADHNPVINAMIFANTLVDNVSGIEIGKNYTGAPKDVLVAFNLVKAPANKAVQIFKPASTVSFIGNVMWTGGGGLGANLMSAEAKVADPGLVKLGDLWVLGATSPAIDAADQLGTLLPVDIDGQQRNKADVGADERGSALGPRKPLTAADVGPNAP